MRLADFATTWGTMRSNHLDFPTRINIKKNTEKYVETVVDKQKLHARTIPKLGNVTHVEDEWDIRSYSFIFNLLQDFFPHVQYLHVYLYTHAPIRIHAFVLKWWFP